MPRILSFGASDELYQRVITQQEKEGVLTLSEFPRTLVDDSLRVLEQTDGKEEKNNA